MRQPHRPDCEETAPLLSAAQSPELELDLSSVNSSPFPAITSDRYERFKPQQPVPEDGEGEGPFYFDIDAGTYWFAPLGRCFGISEKDVSESISRMGAIRLAL
jgi:hypothetical protein